MDWAHAIDRNRDALRGIIASLFAMLGLADSVAAAAVPRPLYFAVLRVLRPAESALRRLIVMAARGLKVTLPPRRAMPAGLVLAAKGSGRAAFPLFDSRKRTGAPRQVRTAQQAEPRLHLFAADPLAPPFRRAAAPWGPGPPAADAPIDARPLIRRLEALKLALDDLPRQARRLARWRARRRLLPSPKFTSPLRPGPPPGHRRRHAHPIDQVLDECHWMAREALRPDTS
jgi:hypothetical protein